jgi:membrane-associated phospholipid phosphatase
MIADLNDAGLQIILYLQALGDWITVPMQFFSFLGDEEFFLLIMPALYWCVDAALGLRMGIILLLADNLRIILKLAFHTPRPFWVDPQVRALAYESSFGAPSGHAMNAAAVWGLMAVELRSPWARAALGGLIFLIGFSRITLGVHFPADVLAGWIFGFLLLWSFSRLETPARAWLSRQRLAARLLAAFTLSFAMILAGALVRMGLSNWQMPAAWLENAAAASPQMLETGPLSLSELMTSAGALFGLAAGSIWLYDRRGFETRGPMGKRLLRFPIGLVGVIGLWFGLGALFPRGEFLLAYILRFLRYFLVGFWISALAPLVFIRLGLAASSRPATFENKQAGRVRPAH